jgi:CubicO group peptidase (beta-lactamase class C family)
MSAGYVGRGEVPGLVTLISRRGEVHVDEIGAPRDTIFRITSMTKPVTAVAAMILVEECKLRLDDPVDDTEPARRPITVRDLLTFRMGLGMWLYNTGS